MGRLLAIDYGQKRVGVAVSDPLQITANGLDTVPTHMIMEFLEKYTSTEQVERFIVGSPKQNDNSDSSNMARVKSFVKQLEKAFPDIPISMVDERFTSVLAHGKFALLNTINKTKRRTKMGKKNLENQQKYAIFVVVFID